MGFGLGLGFGFEFGFELEHAEADPLGLIDAVGAGGQRTLVHDARADEEEGPLGLGDHLGG